MPNLALITGGSRGLGKALTSQFLEKGFEVYEISRSGESNSNIKCDLSDLNSVNKTCDNLFKKISEKRWDEIILINNAGVLSPISSVDVLTTDDIALNVGVNQIAAFTIISKFIETFREQDTRKIIVNISSGAAKRGYAGWSLYCASKAACENFIRSVAAEERYKKHPVVAINYNPSVMDTDMQVQIRKSDIKHFPDKQRFLELKTKGGLKTADQVADHIKNLLKTELVSGDNYTFLD